MDATDLSVRVIMIDDGSRDQTPQLMEQLSTEDERFTSVFLSRNFGHQLALSAGLSYVTASEGAFILDGDLQDPPELLDEFYAELKAGNDVVYAIRRKRKEGFFKKIAYRTFYLMLKKIAYIDLPLDSGDFALISRKVVDELNRMPEESRFLRGMRSWIGFRQKGVEYERDERHSGETKYSIKRLLSLALNGIFNFSEFPIKFIINLGILASIISVVYFIITLVKRLAFDSVPEGFTALLFIVILFGGVQLIAIGIIGEYVLRIFFQVKNRPLFIVSKVLNDKKKEEQVDSE